MIESIHEITKKNIKKYFSKINGQYLKENAIFYILLVQCVLLAVFPIPSFEVKAADVLVYIIFALLSLMTVSFFFLQKARLFRFDLFSILVLAFYVLCLYGTVIGFINHVPVTDIIRGLMPFPWLCYAIVVRNAISFPQTRRLGLVVGCVSVIYAVKIFIIYFIYVFGRLGERVTFHHAGATSSLTMVGFLYFLWLYFDGKYKKTGLILSMFLLTSVIMTETKSMSLSIVIAFILVCSLIFLYNGLKRGIKVIRVPLVSSFAIFIVTTGLFGLNARWISGISINTDLIYANISSDVISFFSRIIPSQQTQIMGEEPSKEPSKEPDKEYPVIEIVDDGSYTVRLVEFKTSYALARESYFWGKGIGYRWSSPDADYGGPVIYMHNIFAYFLMSFGLPGVVYLMMAAVAMLISFLKVIKIKDMGKKHTHIIMLFSVLVMMFIYANFFAVIRSIPNIFIIALSLGTYGKLLDVSKENSANES